MLITETTFEHLPTRTAYFITLLNKNPHIEAAICMRNKLNDRIDAQLYLHERFHYAFHVALQRPGRSSFFDGGC